MQVIALPTLLDKIEAILIKSFLLLAALALIFQLVARHPRWADMLVLLNRLEGAVYNSGL